MATIVLVSNGDRTALMIDGQYCRLSAGKLDLHIEPCEKFSIDLGETDLRHSSIVSDHVFFEAASEILGEKIGYK